jgi:hypothetical protein
MSSGNGVTVTVTERMEGSKHEYAGAIEDSGGRSLFRVILPYHDKEDLLRIYGYRPRNGCQPDAEAPSRHHRLVLEYFSAHPRPPKLEELVQS